jgi:hypothetical protein
MDYKTLVSRKFIKQRILLSKFILYVFLYTYHEFL